jgi:predicted CopG family antitoxin
VQHASKIVAPKKISITEEAYKALLLKKKNGESFTKTIIRITKKTGGLSDSFGVWKMTDEKKRLSLEGYLK